LTPFEKYVILKEFCEFDDEQLDKTNKTQSSYDENEESNDESDCEKEDFLIY
jgi:hypothetical protein